MRRTEAASRRTGTRREGGCLRVLGTVGGGVVGEVLPSVRWKGLTWFGLTRKSGGRAV